MRMQLVQPYPAFQTRCSDCLTQMSSNLTPIYADLDGEPFEAYYCVRCTIRKTKGFSEGMESVIRPKFLCCVCHQNPVDAENGYDTCDECIRNQ